MIVTFEKISNGELFIHKDVFYFTVDEVCMGSSGYGLHFIDNTYCLINSKTFRLVSATMENRDDE